MICNMNFHILETARVAHVTSLQETPVCSSYHSRYESGKDFPPVRDARVEVLGTFYEHVNDFPPVRDTRVAQVISLQVTPVQCYLQVFILGGTDSGGDKSFWGGQTPQKNRAPSARRDL